MDRTNKGITPTEIGLYLYGEAQKVIAMLASIEREIELTRNPLEDLLVGASSTLGESALPCTLLIFQKRFPGYSISIDIGNTLQIYEKIISRRIEVGLLEGPIQQEWKEQLLKEDISTQHIAQTDLILVAGSNSKYVDIDSLNIEDLYDLPIIVREKGSGIRATFEKTVAERGLDLNNFNLLYEMNTSSSIVSAIASDMGVALLPIMAVRKELHHKILKAISIKDTQFQHNFYLLYRNGSKKKSHKEFVNFLISKDRGFC